MVGYLIYTTLENKKTHSDMYNQMEMYNESIGKFNELNHVIRNWKNI